jgi:UDP-N-acetylmuramoylalanine--D-glutamate ligase
MLPEYLRNTRIGILGFGVNHQALVRWLLNHGATDVVIYDESEAAKERISVQGLEVETVLGLGAFDQFDVEILFRSPGISPDRPELVKARESGVKITSQVNLFFELCPARIIGVTGSKGKGTTSTLIAEMLRAGLSDSTVYLAGNIEKDPFEFLDILQSNDIVVLELSSFQLVDLERSPQIAVVLGITSDHLEYHKTQPAYVEAKSAIVRYQTAADHAILNIENTDSLSFAELTQAKLHYYSTDTLVDDGVSIHDGNFLQYSPDRASEVVASVTDVKLRGKHNLGNAAAAIMAVKLCGVRNEAIQNVLRSFAGLPHRIQLVHESNGIAWYDDSIATNSGSVIAAIQSFIEPIILIAGGSDKGLDYAELGDVISSSNVKFLLLIGQTAGAIAEAAEQHDFPSERIVFAGDLATAVQEAVKSAVAGEVVLLSPASASYDQFPNYKVRGEQFAALAKQYSGQEATR